MKTQPHLFQRCRLSALALWLGLALAGHALAESGVLIRTSDLKQKPFLDATTTGSVASGSNVTITSRQGAWLQVKSANGQSGWVKLLNVRTSTGTSSGSVGGTLGTLGKVITTGSSGTTVTTGVKGLTSGEVTSTHPDPQQLNKLNGYATSSSQAAQSARSANLSRKSGVPDISPTSTATPGSNP
ncbi:flagellar basal body rod protein FlgF [Silvimonas terrae]|uniref:Flagellar basal body rod protein FlgF n=1 Tax=Silvimonas terrae TaxID=300266 RepID=A0A840RKH0_9NEIS|nr:SH3 domain-containing protein [Silvimonas terrae]MBB5192970.1 flagellar basal body rod protein FlgF [Silvimonas terrae]